MSADAIARVTTALQARLQAALVAASDPGSVFVGPFDDPQAQAASLSLFPYRIVPNASLRNTEHRVPAPTPPPPTITYRDALPLDLYYLVSVGSRPGASEEPLLRVLGFAIQSLQIEPDLPAATVTPSSMSVSLEPDPVRVTFEPLSTDEISRIWALWPTANYRTSLAYLVSPVWIDPPQPPAVAAPVLRDSLGAGHADPRQPSADGSNGP
jgi:hypothetical protein